MFSSMLLFFNFERPRIRCASLLAHVHAVLDVGQEVQCLRKSICVAALFDELDCSARVFERVGIATRSEDHPSFHNREVCGNLPITAGSQESAFRESKPLHGSFLFVLNDAQRCCEAKGGLRDADIEADALCGIKALGEKRLRRNKVVPLYRESSQFQ